MMFLRAILKVHFRFVIGIALPLGGLFALGLVGVRYFVDLPPQVWAALVAGAVIATGWITSVIFAELERAEYD